jgi:hypothetical protein
VSQKMRCKTQPSKRATASGPQPALSSSKGCEPWVRDGLAILKEPLTLRVVTKNTKEHQESLVKSLRGFRGYEFRTLPHFSQEDGI